MQFKGMELCDFCFSNVNSGEACGVCGLTHGNYKNLYNNILQPGTILLGKYIVGRVLKQDETRAAYLAMTPELEKVVITEYLPTAMVVRGDDGEMLNVAQEYKNQFLEGAKSFVTTAERSAASDIFYNNGTVYFCAGYGKASDVENTRDTVVNADSAANSIANNAMTENSSAQTDSDNIRTSENSFVPENIFAQSESGSDTPDFQTVQNEISVSDEQNTNTYAPYTEAAEENTANIQSDIFPQTEKNNSFDFPVIQNNSAGFAEAETANAPSEQGNYVDFSDIPDVTYPQEEADGANSDSMVNQPYPMQNDEAYPAYNGEPIQNEEVSSAYNGEPIQNGEAYPMQNNEAYMPYNGEAMQNEPQVQGQYNQAYDNGQNMAFMSPDMNNQFYMPVKKKKKWILPLILIIVGVCCAAVSAYLIITMLSDGNSDKGNGGNGGTNQPEQVYSQGR